MAWYRRSRFVYDALKRFNLLLFPKTTPIIQSKTPRINPNSSYSLFYNQHKKFPGVLGTPSVSSRLSLGFRLGNINNNQNKKLYSCVGRRYYSYFVDRNQVHHFKPRFPSWYVKPINAMFGVLCCGVAIISYYGKYEVVPFTKRKHFVVLSRSYERKLGEIGMSEIEEEFDGSILPSKHPGSVRINLITNNIIQAALALNTRAVSQQEQVSSSSKRNMLKKQGAATAATTEHLKEMNWQVIVVNKPIVNAYCFPGGKIVVFAGLIKKLDTDAELATVIAHEVGHAVARHTAEQITQLLGFLIFELILYKLITPNFVDLLSSLLYKAPYSRKMEIEADYIGLLLMASAGYDPRTAPQVYEKLERKKSDGELSAIDNYLATFEDYCSTHPSGQRRAQLLARDDVMDEALEIYHEVVAR